MTHLTEPSKPVRISIAPEREPPLTDREKLAAYLGLSLQTESPRSGYPLLAPLSFVRRMTPGDLNDPLLRQVLPDAAEDRTVAGFSSDPVGDDAATAPEGFLQKYAGRALLPVTSACALHCRFCFRRNRPSERYLSDPEMLDRAVTALSRRTDIHEIILSGGDPLMLPADILERLLWELSRMSHITRVRIHTRMPIAAPARVNGVLMGVLASCGKPLVAVVHTNHPNELNDETSAALGRISDRAAALLNQSVLLRGVNDSAEVLSELSEKLFAQGVLPYYLHQLDRAHGTAHFEVPEEEGVRIVQKLRTRSPGWLVPRYVRETPGEPCKTALL